MSPYLSVLVLIVLLDLTEPRAFVFNPAETLGRILSASQLSAAPQSETVIESRVDTETEPSAENVTNLVQDKINFILDKLRGVQPSELAVNTSKSVLDTKVNFLLDTIKKLNIPLVMEKEVDSWENWDDEKEAVMESGTDKTSASAIGFYILELMGSLAGLVLGAIGQLNIGLNPGTNNTIG